MTDPTSQKPAAGEESQVRSLKPLTERLARIVPAISQVLGSEQARLEAVLATHFPDLWPLPSDASRLNPLSLVLGLDLKGDHHRLLHWLLSDGLLRPAAAEFLWGILARLEVPEAVSAEFLRRIREGHDVCVSRSPWYGPDWTGSQEETMPDIVIQVKPYLMILEVSALTCECGNVAPETDRHNEGRLLRYEKVADKYGAEGYTNRWLVSFALDARRQISAKARQCVAFSWHELVPILVRSANCVEDAYLSRFLKDYIVELQSWIARRSGLLTAVGPASGATRISREARVFVKDHIGEGDMSGQLFQDLIKVVGPCYADLVDVHSVWMDGVAALLESLTKRTIHGLSFEFGGPAPQSAWRTRVNSRQFVALAWKKNGKIKMRIRVVVTNLRGEAAAIAASMVDIETGLDQKMRLRVREVVERLGRRFRDEKPDAPLDFFSEWAPIEKVATPEEFEKWADRAVRTALDDAESVCNRLGVEPKWIVKE